jgi:hypothetical protein
MLEISFDYLCEQEDCIINNIDYEKYFILSLSKEEKEKHVQELKKDSRYTGYQDALDIFTESQKEKIKSVAIKEIQIEYEK